LTPAPGIWDARYREGFMAIALNVGRSRINLLSLVLALYLFATGVYITLGDEFDVPAVWVFLTSFVPIVIGFSFALVGLILFLLCQRLDADGTCEVWTFSIGELLTYLAMAQTLSGCVQNLVRAVDSTLVGVFEYLQLDAATTAELGSLAEGLHGWMSLGCGIVWGGLIYVAPAVFLYRALVPRWGKWALGGGYVVLLLVTFWVSAYPYQIKARTAGAQTTMSGFFVRQFWQPELWGAETAELAEFQKRRAETLFEP
jgi:hypothetical protein